MAKRKRSESAMKITEKLADTFDLPLGVVAGLPKIEITGCRELYMENHHGILEYGSGEIDIGGGQVIVKIKGQDLMLRSMTARELSVSGLIMSVEFVF